MNVAPLNLRAQKLARLQRILVLPQVGAPFWFDPLNKFILIRSIVKPKEKREESED